jgi:hypothetical protein
MSRYLEYQDRLAGHTIGETFDRAAAFLVLASAAAEVSADENDLSAGKPGGVPSTARDKT